MRRKKATLNELIAQKMTILQQEGRNGSYYNYRTLLHYIEDHFGIVDIKDVNPSFGKKLKKAMTSEGKSGSTICNYFSLFAAVFNYAVYKGYASADDYPIRRKSYELDKPAKPKQARRTDWFLKKEQMQRIYEEWENATKKGTVRNVGIFLASYLCNGANLADIMRLRYNSDYYKSDRQILTFIRKKTQGRSDAKVTVPIIPQLKKIMDTIGDKEKPNGLVFGSFLKDIDVNDEVAMDKRVMYLNTHISKTVKIFCNRHSITGHISVSYARHTYATVLNHQGAPFALVEMALGHRLSGVASNYIGMAPIEKMFEINSMLL